MSSWNGIHLRSAYFLSWSFGELYGNLILPMTPGSVKHIHILFRVDHRVCRGPRKSIAPGCQEWESSARSWVRAKQKAQAHETPNRCRALSSFQSMSLNAITYFAFISNRPAHCHTDHLEEQHLRCGILNKLNSTSSTLTALWVVYYSSRFSNTLIIKTFTWFPGENMIKFYSEILSKCDSAKWKGFQARIKPALSMAEGERTNLLLQLITYAVSEEMIWKTRNIICAN